MKGTADKSTSANGMLNDEGASRVHEHTKSRSIGIIGVCRHDATLSEQEIQALLKSDFARIKADLRSEQCGYINIKAQFVDDDGQIDVTKADDVSLLVIGDTKDDSGHLKSLLKDLGRKYHRDSVLYKPYDRETAVIIGLKDGVWPGQDQEHDVGPFHPRRMSDFQAALNKNAPCKFSDIFIYTTDYQRGFFSRGPEKETPF